MRVSYAAIEAARFLGICCLFGAAIALFRFMWIDRRQR